MPQQILLTSFDVWEPHHVSNASDDLLIAIGQDALLDELEPSLTLLRKLPVDFERAPQQVLAEINTLQPDLILCCGMAESRKKLTLESNGKHEADVLWTTIDLDRLVENLAMTNVSHDAGNFVCNHLYYSVLKQIQSHQLSCQCLFIHVPVLNESNRRSILQDFLTISQRLSSQPSNDRNISLLI